MELSIYRYNPATDDKPSMQAYTIDPSRCKGNMLLDALELIKAEQDASLAFRRSCGEGVCGSDGMNINGKNGLACITRMADLPNKVVLRPLPGLPVVRDLIVDMAQFYKNWERAEPYLQTDGAAPVKEHIQSPEQRAALDGLYECILCACCSSACPSYWWNPDKFMGPAALLAALRFVADSRDTHTAERLEQLMDAYSLYRCRSIMNCVDACPKGLNPTQAISKLRSKIAKKEAEH